MLLSERKRIKENARKKRKESINEILFYVYEQEWKECNKNESPKLSKFHPHTYVHVYVDSFFLSYFSSSKFSELNFLCII